MAGAWLVVRAVVADPADRAAFDEWYRLEHLPDAMKAFAVHTAWRGWSTIDHSVHCAYYGFESLNQIDTVTSGPEMRALIAEFDRCWEGRVTRTREVVAVADEIGGQKNSVVR
jgi:hypothetical protein